MTRTKNRQFLSKRNSSRDGASRVLSNDNQVVAFLFPVLCFFAWLLATGLWPSKVVPCPSVALEKDYHFVRTVYVYGGYAC